MTDFNASDRDVTRAIRSWLHEDRHEDVSRIAAAVLDQVEATPRRRARWWPARRFPDMNTFAKVLVATAAVVAVAVVGINLLPGSQTGAAVPRRLSPTPAVNANGVAASERDADRPSRWRPAAGHVHRPVAGRRYPGRDVHRARRVGCVC